MGDEMTIAVDAGRGMLWTAIKVGLPVLLVCVGLGLLAAFFQAVTQMNEASLSFVPKLVGTLALLLALLPWVLVVLSEYAEGVFGSMSTWFP
jgi:flagellar biosynthetic protein FliQ